MIHILNGAEAASRLQEAFLLDENLRGEILILDDQLACGPILPDEISSLDVLRTAYWHQLSPHHREMHLQDEAHLNACLTQALESEEPLCLWMAPNADDICTYYWLLPYFKSYPGVLHTIQLAGLPFLNEKGQLFYPEKLASIPPKEFVKTKRLLREVTLSEMETDGDEWSRLSQEDTWVRIYEGGKKIVSKPMNYFDQTILQHCGTEFQKASKVVNDTLKRLKQAPHPGFIEWRLRQLIQLQALELKGDADKTTREFDVRKAGPAADQTGPELA